ncbi:MAG TPA: hypothetical protein PKD12_14715 [Nitrospira sp.]|nr:hypothetical protein [Nitrospira sp.]
MLDGFELQDLTLYLTAILVLLVLWQYYQLQILSGRILAVDIFDRSGIRMYLYVAPDDDQTCEACASAHGRLFLPSHIAKKNFSPLTRTCTRTTPCNGVLPGLYGAWPEARGVLENLRKNFTKGGHQLSAEEVRALVNGQWERCISAATDRVSVYMIQAMVSERVDQEVSMEGYRFVVNEAKDVRHLMLLVPAYLRLTQLLIQAGEEAEALEIIELFERRFPQSKRGVHFPLEPQRDLMKAKKSLLMKNFPYRISA